MKNTKYLQAAEKSGITFDLVIMPERNNNNTAAVIVVARVDIFWSSLKC